MKTNELELLINKINQEYYPKWHKQAGNQLYENCISLVDNFYQKPLQLSINEDNIINFLKECTIHFFNHIEQENLTKNIHNIKIILLNEQYPTLEFHFYINTVSFYYKVAQHNKATYYELDSTLYVYTNYYDFHDIEKCLYIKKMNHGKFNAKQQNELLQFIATHLDLNPCYQN